MMTRTGIHLDARLGHPHRSHQRSSSPVPPAGPEEEELIPVAMRLIWDVDEVVDVISRVNQATGPQHAIAAGDRGDSPQ